MDAIDWVGSAEKQFTCQPFDPEVVGLADVVGRSSFLQTGLFGSLGRHCASSAGLPVQFIWDLTEERSRSCRRRKQLLRVASQV